MHNTHKQTVSQEYKMDAESADSFSVCSLLVARASRKRVGLRIRKTGRREEKKTMMSDENESQELLSVYTSWLPYALPYASVSPLLPQIDLLPQRLPPVKHERIDNSAHRERPANNREDGG